MRLTHVILYVADIPTSVGFYGALLDREPVELHPSFAAFDLGGGFTLGLWQESTVSPAPEAPGRAASSGLRSAMRPWSRSPGTNGASAACPSRSP